jgi:hypothetical protein
MSSKLTKEMIKEIDQQADTLKLYLTERLGSVEVEKTLLDDAFYLLEITYKGERLGNDLFPYDRPISEVSVSLSPNGKFDFIYGFRMSDIEGSGYYVYNSANAFADTIGGRRFGNKKEIDEHQEYIVQGKAAADSIGQGFSTFRVLFDKYLDLRNSVNKELYGPIDQR